MKKQSGSAHVIIVIILVVALLGSLGFIFWQNFMAKDSDTKSDEKQTAKQEDKKKVISSEKAEERISLGSLSFVAPETWTDIKSSNYDSPRSIQGYSFKLGDDIKPEGVEFSVTEISLYKTSDMIIDVGSEFAYSYSASNESWNQIKKKPIKQMTGIFADFWADGVPGSYSSITHYMLVKGEYVVAVHVQEQSRGENLKTYTKLADQTSSTSNDLQKQVVSLLDSVR